MKISPQPTTRNTFDIYFAGVGGQGLLTIGEIIAETAFRQGIPVNFYPTKGMAQRGGFVKAQLRMGRETIGPSIPEKGADLVIATEVSESLKAIRFLRPDGDFVLYGHVWEPTAVMLGKAPYPAVDQVLQTIRDGGAKLHYIAPDSLPMLESSPVPDNVYTLGVAMAATRLREWLTVSSVENVLQTRWHKGVERNLLAFRSGLESAAVLAQ